MGESWKIKKQIIFQWKGIKADLVFPEPYLGVHVANIQIFISAFLSLLSLWLVGCIDSL